MSMIAKFVQVEPAELADLQADPTRAEALFSAGHPVLAQLAAMSAGWQDRVRQLGPKLLSGMLDRLDPATRAALEQRLGASAEGLAAGQGGEALLQMMQQRLGPPEMPTGSGTGQRPSLSLDKAWHGVHYVLCGRADPGRDLLSQPVMGGTDLGDDDEGFSGYGPARCFTPREVMRLSLALNDPALPAQAAARFDVGRMAALDIYPGFEPTDSDEILEKLAALKAFFADAAAHGRGIVTCLV